MAPQNATARTPITMELAFDGKGAVSGTITGEPRRGRIRSGTYDPKTGSLKLEVEVKGESAVSHFVFEGAVVEGTAAGKVSGNNQIGDFKVAKK